MILLIFGTCLFLDKYGASFVNTITNECFPTQRFYYTKVRNNGFLRTRHIGLSVMYSLAV
uniref:Uncharacterized protein n=1 Tax=Rhizophagus irregularis (strain DAOM 181602 / DAOM 197198 / MUCL 43194) TaxID=747089 RepID=U9USK6_RHIID